MSGNVYRALRKARKLNQADVADFIGVSTPQISKLENGHARLNDMQLKRMAMLFGVGPEVLLRDSIDIPLNERPPLSSEERHIGARLEQVRAHIEPDLPRLIGVNGGQWKLYVEGRDEVPASVVRDASGHTGVPASYILTGDISGMAQGVLSLLVGASVPRPK